MRPTGPFLEVVSGAGEIDAEIEQVLGAARTWVEPSAEHRERVTLALRGALPALSDASGPAHARRPGEHAPPAEHALPAEHMRRGGRELPGEGAPPRSVASTRSAATRHWAAPKSAASPLGRAGVALGGALIGALGFWLGHGVGYGEGQRDAASARVAEAFAARSALLDAATHSAGAAPVASGAGMGSAMATPPPSTPSDLTSPPSTSPLSSSSLSSSSLSSSSRSSASTASDPPPEAPSSRPSKSARVATAPPPSRRAPPRRSRARHPTTAEPAPSRMSFREVLDELRRAQQQLRSGNATMSLLLLSELDRSAGDVLLEERDATRVLALCAVGQEGAAREVASQLSHDSPRSIYGMRLEASCISDAPSDDASPSRATERHDEGREQSRDESP